MPKFKNGDRVIYAHPGVLQGRTGTIIDGDRSCPGVRFDVYKLSLHDCGGLCEDGYGYYCNEDHLRGSGDMTFKFKPGDRVVVVQEGHQLTVGMTGTVLESSTAPWIDWDVHHWYMEGPSRDMKRRYPGARSLWCSCEKRLQLIGTANLDPASKKREW